MLASTQEKLGQLDTDALEASKGCSEIWSKLCCAIFLQNLAVPVKSYQPQRVVEPRHVTNAAQGHR